MYYIRSKFNDSGTARRGGPIKASKVIAGIREISHGRGSNATRITMKMVTALVIQSGENSKRCDNPCRRDTHRLIIHNTHDESRRARAAELA